MNKTIGKLTISTQISYSHLSGATYEGKKVLVKRLNAKLSSSGIVEKIKRIKHKNVLALTDVVENQYLVYEFCSEESLTQYVKKHGGSLDEEGVKPLLRQLLDVYKIFNDNGLLHLRFYPGDILITEEQIVKVGNICLGMSENSYSDIWSIGIITYYMLHGRSPYRDIEQLPLDDEFQYTVKNNLSPCCHEVS